ncbi:MAG: hypothetical protein IJP61_05540 [Treponema sp.]|nr:hypothetical protein [Treponema sp.]
MKNLFFLFRAVLSLLALALPLSCDSGGGGGSGGVIPLPKLLKIPAPRA